MNDASYEPLISPTGDRLRSVKLSGAVFVITISRFIFGFDRGVFGGSSLGLINKSVLTQKQYAEIVSLPMLASVPTCIIVGWFLKRYGRKKALLISSLLYVVGCATIVVFSRPTVVIFMLGRILCNISFAMGHVTAMVYLVELCPKDWRGKVMMVNQMMLPLGNTLAGIVNITVSKVINSEDWRLMLGTALVPSILQLVCVIFIPGSYKWLYSTQQREKARSEANKLYVDLTQDTFLEICNQQKCQEKVIPRGSLNRMVTLSAVLMIIPQLAGFSAVMYYSVQIAQLAGISTDTNTFIVSEGIFLTNFIGTMIAIPLIERVGRRTLLLVSLVGTIIAIGLIILAIDLMDNINLDMNPMSRVVIAKCLVSKCSQCISQKECGYCTSPNTTLESYCMSGHGSQSYLDRCEIEGNQWLYSYCDSNDNWFIFVSILMFVIYFSIGLAPVPFLITSELFPQSYRDKVMGFTLSVYYAGTATVALGFGELQYILGVQNLFIVFGMCTLVGIIFLYLYLPETKGKSTEDMYELFDNNWCCTTTSNTPQYHSIQ